VDERVLFDHRGDREDTDALGERHELDCHGDLVSGGIRLEGEG
jgi:hypothetical protein